MTHKNKTNELKYDEILLVRRQICLEANESSCDEMDQEVRKKVLWLLVHKIKGIV